MLRGASAERPGLVKVKKQLVQLGQLGSGPLGQLSAWRPWQLGQLGQGANSIRQGIDSDGRANPVHYVLETPGYGCVIEITNTGPMEYPLTASCVPYTYSYDALEYGSEAVVGGDDRSGRGHASGGFESPWNDQDTVY